MLASIGFHHSLHLSYLRYLNRGLLYFTNREIKAEIAQITDSIPENPQRVSQSILALGSQAFIGWNMCVGCGGTIIWYLEK